MSIMWKLFLSLSLPYPYQPVPVSSLTHTTCPGCPLFCAHSSPIYSLPHLFVSLSLPSNAYYSQLSLRMASCNFRLMLNRRGLNEVLTTDRTQPSWQTTGRSATDWTAKAGLTWQWTTATTSWVRQTMIKVGDNYWMQCFITGCLDGLWKHIACSCWLLCSSLCSISS